MTCWCGLKGLAVTPEQLIERARERATRLYAKDVPFGRGDALVAGWTGATGAARGGGNDVYAAGDSGSLSTTTTSLTEADRQTLHRQALRLKRLQVVTYRGDPGDNPEPSDAAGGEPERGYGVKCLTKTPALTPPT
jgi:hypothetical protein